jgi:hypothetical protein
MKKILTFCMVLVFLYPASNPADAQTLPPLQLREFGKPSRAPAGNSGAFFQCNPTSLYGQRPFTQILAGIPCIVIDLIDAETAAIDNYLNVDKPVTGITFWGTFHDMEDFCEPTMPISFRIRFYEIGRNIIPDPIHQVELVLSGQLYLLDTMLFYRFDATFPEPLNLPQEGLISILQVIDESDEPCFFHWIVSEEGDQASVVYSMIFGEVQEMEMLPVDFAFCLNAGHNIPIPKWVFVFSFLLILAATYIRYRRIS